MSVTIQSCGISTLPLATIGEVTSSIEHGTGVLISVEGDNGPFSATIRRDRQRVDVEIFHDDKPSMMKWKGSFYLSSVDPIGIFRITKVVLEEFSGVQIDSE